jgi:threonine aldolase
MTRCVDLRSDTVTKPVEGMREAIAAAEVGDDVYDEDPTVKKLQTMSAELTGHEAALFFPTGSMANQTAINIHTKPGDEVICEEQGHIYNYEMATMSAFSGTIPRPVPGENGFLTAKLVEKNIRPSIYYRPDTGLVSLENTHNLRGGRIHPQDQVEEIIAFCHARGIPVHLDGARVFNAAVASCKPVSELTSSFDSVMFCVSKGLGAPIGSMLCGSTKFIERAWAVRKMFGGGMRQVGVLAAAGLYALEHHVDRLAEDHQRARKLAAALSAKDFIHIEPEQVETNIIVFKVNLEIMNAQQFVEKMSQQNILCGAFDEETVRMVTHLHISDSDVEYVLDVVANKL